MICRKKHFPIKHINSFFIEIIIVTFFFIISSAINVMVIAKAFEQKKDTEKLNNAVLKAQSICEVFSTTAELENTLELLYGNDSNSFINDDNASIPFDSDWEISASNTKYIIDIHINNNVSSAGNLVYAEVNVLEDTDVLFSVTTSAYISEKEDLNG